MVVLGMQQVCGKFQFSGLTTFWNTRILCLPSGSLWYFCLQAVINNWLIAYVPGFFFSLTVKHYRKFTHCQSQSSQDSGPRISSSSNSLTESFLFPCSLRRRLYNELLSFQLWLGCHPYRCFEQDWQKKKRKGFPFPADILFVSMAKTLSHTYLNTKPYMIGGPIRIYP